MGEIVFDCKFSSVRVIFVRKSYREQENLSSKTVLDTFFASFHYAKNTRTDVFNNFTQRILIQIFIIKNE
ncbi:hypothetical protein B6A10_16015 [Flavobacterium sp. L1I52]|uniref:Uncharacterized protein n=1 Tax=Flavobacterium pokkalii TaxID=1940408 RepID=A0ABR7UUT8_9FLAO|nr:hypothetical protein [Flavobacterium pokkalii]